ncbi:MAG: hypothetical protein ACKO04_10370 [Actinomycetes bacterium]
MRSIRAASIAVTVATALAMALPLAAPASAAPQDACLRGGSWTAETPKVNALLQKLMPPGAFTVDSGRLVLRFRPGFLDYDGFMKVTTDLGGATLSTEASWLNSNRPWRTTRGTVVFGPGRSRLEWGDWTATKGGETVSVPGPKPSTTTTPAGQNPYRCSGTTLRWPVPIPSRDNPTTVTFTRR